MNKLSLILLLCTAGFLNTCFSQTPNKFWVRFTDKNNSPYSVSTPTAYLSAKAIQRRTNQGIQIDMTDIPVNQTYISQVTATGATILGRSKWMNAAIVYIANNTQLNAINSLSCVIGSAPVGRVQRGSSDAVTPVTQQQTQAMKTSGTTSTNYGPSVTQASQIGADCLHNQGFRGQNMVIAVLDAGFQQADVNPVFDSLRNENRILGTYDFVMGNTMVYEDDAHGAMVLSCISGNSPGQLVGTGPKAKVWLLRSEDNTSEKIIEEYNFIVAAEFADSVGADICTTSLGYSTFDNASQNHVYADLNGRSPSSLASTMGVRKGMFMLNAAGNEGASPWHYINIPADADSICTVGAVNSSGVHAGFSSVGPTADGRIKPEISTMGEGAYVCGPGYNFFAGNGTSFATPIAAGAVACLWQAHPTKTPMQLLNALKATASRASTPDNNYGWGIPNFCSAHSYLALNTGINEAAQSTSIEVYPNPASNLVRFQLGEAIQQLEIRDVLGHEIAYTIQSNGDTHTVSFDTGPASGIYFISIRSGAAYHKAKFIKH